MLIDGFNPNSSYMFLLYNSKLLTQRKLHGPRTKNQLRKGAFGLNLSTGYNSFRLSKWAPKSETLRESG
jgi:hypothetical protein